MLEKIRKYLDEKYPSGFAGYSPLYALTHPWKIIEFWSNHVTWAFQRVFYGWDERAVWSIDVYLAKLIPQLVERLAVKKHGIPFSIILKYPHDENYNCTDETFELARQEWVGILHKIADGFKAYIDEDDWSGKNEEDPRFIEAFNLFKEYFPNLWD